MPLARLLQVVFVSCVLSALPSLAADKVAEAQSAVTNWAKIRHETLRLETEWESEKTLLASMEAAMESRRESLEEQKRALLARALGRETSQADLTEQIEAAKAGLASVGDSTEKLREALLLLRPRLPPRLSRGLEMAFRSLATPGLSTAERSQHLAAILSRCAQFNQTVTWGEEPLQDGDGAEERLIEVVYWGLSSAYGLDRFAGEAYVGRPSADRWVWEKQTNTASVVAALVAQARDQADPAFLPLPARIDHLPRETDHAR